MNRVKHIGIILGIVILPFLIFSQTAYASVVVDTFDQAAYAYYIGAGTIAIITQVLIGLMVGGAALIGIYRVRVKSFLANLFAGRKQDKDSGENKESGQGE